MLAILGPGPSAGAFVSRALEAPRLIAVGNAFELVERADALVHADGGWWMKHPAALLFPAKRYCNTREVEGCELLRLEPGLNSGVLALHVAARMGARDVRMYGFDMHGSHFFGPYKNGLRNTSEQRRLVMLDQFDAWAKANPGVRVINCTPGSAIRCFPFGD